MVERRRCALWSCQLLLCATILVAPCLLGKWFILATARSAALIAATASATPPGDPRAMAAASVPVAPAAPRPWAHASPAWPWLPAQHHHRQQLQWWWHPDHCPALRTPLPRSPCPHGRTLTHGRELPLPHTGHRTQRCHCQTARPLLLHHQLPRPLPPRALPLLLVLCAKAS